MGDDTHEVRVNLHWLDDVWPAIDEAYNDLERVDAAHQERPVDSDRTDDEQTDTGQMLYVYAHNFLVAARDNQEALHALLHDQVWPFAVWNLIRPTFESSFYALFLLDTDDPRERLLRSLRIRADNLRQHKLLMDTWEAIDPHTSDASRAARRAHDDTTSTRQADEAHRLHLSRKQITETINVAREVVRLPSLQDDTKDPRTYELVWRQLSGIQHANLRAVLVGSQTRRLTPIRGGHTAEMSVDDSNLTNVCSAALRLQLEAARAYTRRTTTKS